MAGGLIAANDHDVGSNDRIVLNNPIKPCVDSTIALVGDRVMRSEFANIGHVQARSAEKKKMEYIVD